MNNLIHFFHPKQKINYFNKLKTDLYIYQVFIIVPIILFFSIQNLISPDDNFLFSFLPKVIIAIYLIISLFILKSKGIKFAGNIFSILLIIIVIIPMNIFPENTPVMYKYVYGLYSVFGAFAYGLLFANRIILLINAGLIFITSIRIYHFALTQSSEYLDFYKAGFFNHTFVFFTVVVLLFFIHKFTELAINKANDENKLQKQQNEELIIVQEKLKENEVELKKQNTQLDTEVNKRTKELQNLNEEIITHNEELKSAIEKYEISEKKLLQNNATKDKFFSIIAHDLKNPFNSMIGFSQLLTENFDNLKISEQKQYIKYIHQGIDGTHNLLDNLLIWARTQSDTIEYEPNNENLFLLTVGIIKLLKQSADKKSLNLINQIKDDIIVFADKNMIETVLRNLISNAIKFTKKDGEIVLTSRLVTNKDKQDFVEISVKDTGIGISSEILSKLFVISENTSTKGTNNETGTGLGLILSKEFIEKHGGEIWVESAKGEGSVFTFSIPKIG